MARSHKPSDVRKQQGACAKCCVHHSSKDSYCDGSRAGAIRECHCEAVHERLRVTDEYREARDFHCQLA